MEEVGGNFYEKVGGKPTFSKLVSAFYRGVALIPILLPLYPEDDLVNAEERLTLFLVQYWGGPQTYSEQRGHPRLRMRHANFRISEIEKTEWLRLISDAVETLGLSKAEERELLDYLKMAAESLVNSR